MSHCISTEHWTSTTATDETRRRTLVAIVREVVVIALGFMAYRQVRHLTSDELGRATENAHAVVTLEQSLGIFTERSVQQAALRSHLLIEVLDHYYVFVHFTASFGFMAWMYLRHPEAWGRVRSWFAAVTVSGLAIHVAFPLAPPRMLAEHGFVDTLHEYGPSIYGRDVTNSAANQLAAMPSLHFAWAVIVAAGVLSVRRSRWAWLVVLHPVVTLLAIVATANHYWSDAVVGGSLVAATVLVQRAVGHVLGRPQDGVLDPHGPRERRPLGSSAQPSGDPAADGRLAAHRPRPVGATRLPTGERMLGGQCVTAGGRRTVDGSRHGPRDARGRHGAVRQR